MGNFEELISLHLSDSALPTGGFAYSSGMEAILEFGMIKDEEELRSYIFEYVKQCLTFDFPYISSIYRIKNFEKEAEFLRIIEIFDASFIASSMYHASLNLGRNWVRIMEEVFGESHEIKNLKLFFKDKELPLHYLFVCTLSLKILNLSLNKIMLFHVNNLLRDQISAAIRLGAIGPIQGHKLQFELSRKLSAFTEELKLVPGKPGQKTGFIPELAQMLQKNVYSKLFKN